MDDHILYKYFNNEASPEEVAVVDRWLSESSGHQEEFAAAHMLFNAMVLNEDQKRP